MLVVEVVDNTIMEVLEEVDGVELREGLLHWLLLVVGEVGMEVQIPQVLEELLQILQIQIMQEVLGMEVQVY